MKGNRGGKYSLLFFILFVAVLTQPSCKKSGMDLSDLLGVWTFQNSVTEYSQFIDAEWNVRMNADNTYRIEALSSQDQHGYDCRGAIFRLLLHYPIYNTHIVFRFIWEGEMPDEGELAGKIYFANIPDSGNDLWDYRKEAEIGRFAARRLSD